MENRKRLSAFFINKFAIGMLAIVLVALGNGQLIYAAAPRNGQLTCVVAPENSRLTCAATLENSQLVHAVALRNKQLVCAGMPRMEKAEIRLDSGKVYQGDRLYSGWYITANGKKSYAVDGNRIKGWYKINKKYYYFSENYKLVVNKIVGSKADGYYYVDKDGVRVTAKEVRQAVAFVTKYSSFKLSRQKRLKQCYQAIRKYPYHHMSAVAPSAGRIPSYANYMFTAKKGNCYRYGSAMSYIGRVLGYDTRLAVGAVTSRGPYASLSPHGWCEVKIGKNWEMIDCSMQRFNLKKNLFLVTRRKYPYRLRCDKVHAMTIRKGKVKWS